MTDTDETMKLWLNAMSLIRPSDEFLIETGRWVVDTLLSGPRPEPDANGIRPYRKMLVEVTCS